MMTMTTMIYNAAERCSAMAAHECETSSDDADDNAEVIAETAETTEQTDNHTNASPWVITKAHLKVTAGRKHAGKSSKRGAAGGKAKKKAASKTGPDGQKISEVDGQPLMSPTDVDSSMVSPHDPASSLTSSDVSKQLRGTDDQAGDVEQDAAQKANRMLKETVDAMYVTYTFKCLSNF